MPRLVVLGGMAAGMSAASKLKRLRPEWEVLVLDAGPDRSYGACGLPYLLGGEVPAVERLYALEPEEIEARGIELRLRQRVTALREGRKGIEVEDSALGATLRRATTPSSSLPGPGGASRDARPGGREPRHAPRPRGRPAPLGIPGPRSAPRSAVVWGTGLHRRRSG